MKPARRHTSKERSLHGFMEGCNGTASPPLIIGSELAKRAKQLATGVSPRNFCTKPSPVGTAQREYRCAAPMALISPHESHRWVDACRKDCFAATWSD